MKTRIITAIIALCILIPVLCFSHTFIFPMAVAAVGIICVYEMARCIGQKKLLVTLPLYVMMGVAPFLIRYTSIRTFSICAFITIGVFLLYLFTVTILSHGKFTFSDASTLYTVSLYIIAACTSIVYTRDFGNFGKYIYLLIFIGAWVTDTFAYFTGVLFGKHKLIPDVSPKKTIEGSVGGTVFCALFFVGFALLVDYFVAGAEANILLLAIAGIVIALISQIGDLIMSVIKRHYGIKDYGKLFPGHGGMLDRFDSILAVSLGIAMVCSLASLLGINIL